jgi:uncharacterized protein (TIGR02246 family)
MTTTTATATQDETALRGIMQTLSASWAQGDADTMAELYAEDASVLLPGDVYLKGRTAIRDWMAGAFEGKWKGTHVLGVPLELRFPGDDVALLISEGGAHAPDAAEVDAADAIRGIWFFNRTDTGWTISAYENTPVLRPIPMPDAPK